MKKYIKPAIVEVAIDNENILAASFKNANERQGYAGEGGGGFANDFDLDWDEE